MLSEQMDSIGGNLVLEMNLHVYINSLPPIPDTINLHHQNALAVKNSKFQIEHRSIVSISNSSNTSPFFLLRAYFWMFF